MSYLKLFLSFTLFLAASVSCNCSLAQTHSEQEVWDFEQRFVEILEEVLTPFKDNGSLIDVSGGGRSNNRTNIAASRNFDFLAPNGESKVKFEISLGKYDSNEMGLGGAESVERQMASEVNPSEAIRVNEKLDGEGSMGIGDKSYYAGVHSAANTRTSYQQHRHSAYALRGEWLVKIEVASFHPEWNDALKAQQKDLLIRLLDATRPGTNSSTEKPIVDSGHSETPSDVPNLAGEYSGEDGSNFRIQQEGDRIIGTQQIDDVSVTIDTRYTSYTKMNEAGDIEQLGKFMGTFQATSSDGEVIYGEMAIAETDVFGELEMELSFDQDGEQVSASFKMSKK